MKTQNLLIRFALVGFVALSLQSCGLLGAAGLSKQGLSAKKAPANLTAASNTSSEMLDHSNWTTLLQKHVDEAGFVNYKGFQEDKKDLDAYCSYLSSFQPDETWSVQEQLAYYINLYNAYTIKLILENYPTASIKDLDGPWTKAFVPVGNKNLSLGGIENSLLRKMNEPRIHFAINCASFSCPKLLNEAFTANDIDAQLNLVTRDFINSERNEISENQAKVSQLFNWYAKDYLANGTPSVKEFINRYSDVQIAPETTLEFLEYDWSLNEQ
ncbi:DUF547 domain-containing protein [Gilvibacter sp.]|uniref:DUF547 domain-containing protein n=1 Tax=Gilvibacter sp. TaxID=2729997 RepID=UPI003F49EBB7